MHMLPLSRYLNLTLHVIKYLTSNYDDKFVRSLLQLSHQKDITIISEVNMHNEWIKHILLV